MTMANEDVMWTRAREGLVISDGRGGEDVFMWEHTVRVTQAARQVAGGPDVPQADLDLDALTAAALYHDAGWAMQYRQGLINRAELLAKPTSDPLREAGAGLLETELAGVLSPGSLKRAAEAVCSHSQRKCELAEALVLGDAHSLDEIGTLSFWHTVRRQAMEGKGVQAALDTWKRQKEYRFWEARIDNFRFESVRELARRRIQRLESFMAALASEHNGGDLRAAPSPADPRQASAPSTSS